MKCILPQTLQKADAGLRIEVRFQKDEGDLANSDGVNRHLGNSNILAALEKRCDDQLTEFLHHVLIQQAQQSVQIMVPKQQGDGQGGTAGGKVFQGDVLQPDPDHGGVDLPGFLLQKFNSRGTHDIGGLLAAEKNGFRRQSVQPLMDGVGILIFIQNFNGIFQRELLELTKYQQNIRHLRVQLTGKGDSVHLGGQARGVIAV